MRAYGIEIRKRAIEHIESGKSQDWVRKIFKLNKSTVNRWWMRYQKEGHYEARKNKGSKVKIDKNEIIKHITKYPNTKSAELGKKLGVSGRAVLNWLKKLGYSYKKKPIPMWKLMKKSEQHS